MLVETLAENVSIGLAGESWAGRGGEGRSCRMYPELAMRKGGGDGLAELSTRHGLSQAVTQRLA